jgi:hypothetical protein
MIRSILAALALVVMAVLPACGGENGDTDASTVTVLHETCGPDICPSPPTCGSGEVLTCCTCVKVPTTQNAVTTTCDLLGEYCSSTAGDPDISCFMPDGYPTAGTPADVTLHGPVDVYATGGNSDGVLVQVYNVDAEGNIGTLVGEYESTADCADHEADFPTHVETEDEAADCPGPCQEKISPENTDCRTLGYYVIDPVPTNTPLVIKTSQAGGGSLWKDMVSFNIWFFDDEIGADGGIAGHVYYKARVLSVDDWRNIPVAAGDTSGIASGYAAVAGEVHDCSDVRMSFATAGTFPEANTLTYFNGVEEHLYPDLMRSNHGTNIDGLYAAIEMEADAAGSPVYVSALAQVAGVGVVSLGWQKAFVYPETLTSVTLRGTRPDQVE